jgi:hypothetical protein
MPSCLQWGTSRRCVHVRLVSRPSLAGGQVHEVKKRPICVSFTVQVQNSCPATWPRPMTPCARSQAQFRRDVRDAITADLANRVEEHDRSMVADAAIGEVERAEEAGCSTRPVQDRPSTHTHTHTHTTEIFVARILSSMPGDFCRTNGSN